MEDCCCIRLLDAAVVRSCDEELLDASIALLTDESDVACATEEAASLDEAVSSVFCWRLQAARPRVKRSIVAIEEGMMCRLHEGRGKDFLRERSGNNVHSITNDRMSIGRPFSERFFLQQM